VLTIVPVRDVVDTTSKRQVVDKAIAAAAAAAAAANAAARNVHIIAAAAAAAADASTHHPVAAAALNITIVVVATIVVVVIVVNIGIADNVHLVAELKGIDHEIITRRGDPAARRRNVAVGARRGAHRVAVVCGQARVVA
jgi:hypothetical protein